MTSHDIDNRQDIIILRNKYTVKYLKTGKNVFINYVQLLFFNLFIHNYNYLSINYKPEYTI